MNDHVGQGFPRPQVVRSLDVDALPRGRRSRLLVELIQDGLGRPLRLPLLVVRGEKPGPVFGLTAALHGNELNGIPVVHHLMEHVDAASLRGAIVAVAVVNVPGFLQNKRDFTDGQDLNHIMPGRPDGNMGEVFAHRLLERIVRHFDMLVDLHTASFGRVNSLYVRADMTQPRTALMAYLQRPQIILHNPPSDRTLRGAAMELGIPAITVEIGNPHRFQQRYIRPSLIGIRSVMGALGMVPKRPVALGPPPILCKTSRWCYTDNGGLLEVFPELATEVKEGQVIARLTNVFGDLLAEYRCPCDGVVIGKSTNPVAQTGARILHVGEVAGETEHPFVQREPAISALPGSGDPGLMPGA